MQVTTVVVAVSVVVALAALVVAVVALRARGRADGGTRDAAAAAAADAAHRAETAAQATRDAAARDAATQAATERATRTADRLLADAQSQADDVLAASRRQAQVLRDDAEAAAATARQVRERAEGEVEALREDVRRRRDEVERREERTTERESRVDAEARHLEERAEELRAREADLTRRDAELQGLEAERRAVLERTAGLSAEQARVELVAAMEHQAKRDAVGIVREIERTAQADGESRARRIITGAIQRLASEQTAESVVSVLHLPADEMKGRIIGREGRNIRAFEQVTGVNVIIDDTPEAVLLSCFDPVRREVGRLTLEALVLDGRIHPHRIEEQYERSKVEVERLCQRAAEDACAEVGVTDLHPDLLELMGRLRYRTSYGQNVLRHLVESGHLAGLMADELGLDHALCVRAAFLHDVGKALTHESEGSHAIVGAEQARRCGESEDVVHAIEAHHNEVEPRTVEAVLTQAADAISGSRPGARRESLEAYVARLARLEEIAGAHDGVDRVFAMQAGREVRVMVLPDQVDDLQAQVLARDIAKQVEEELTYPGQIRVTVVRESRASEIAR